MRAGRAPRRPRRLAAALAAAVEPLAPATLLGAVQSAWEGAVGERVAAEATPVSERDGIVTVACRSAAWAHELDLLAEEVLAKLRSELADPAAGPGSGPPGGDLRGLRFSARNPEP